MSLTDVDVAIAIGWKQDRDGWWVTPCGTKRYSLFSIPAFTTDLNAITKQIEAEGCYWDASQGRYDAVGTVWDKDNLGSYRAADTTAALAMCRAYVAYKEGSK